MPLRASHLPGGVGLDPTPTSNANVCFASAAVMTPARRVHDRDGRNCYAVRRRRPRATTTPARPLPNRRIDAGSGVGTGDSVLTLSRLSTEPPCAIWSQVIGTEDLMPKNVGCDSKPVKTKLSPLDSETVTGSRASQLLPVERESGDGVGIGL